VKETTMSPTLRRSLQLTFALVLVSAMASAGLKLPEKYVFPMAPKSPGPVTFDHASHTLDDPPDCIVCHPRQFSLLGRPSAEKLKGVTHEAMKRGEYCGACHGKTATKFEHHCDLCHELKEPVEEFDTGRTP
jgi:c(7)-type cytochrome triheme protein